MELTRSTEYSTGDRCRWKNSYPVILNMACSYFLLIYCISMFTFKFLPGIICEGNGHEFYSILKEVDKYSYLNIT